MRLWGLFVLWGFGAPVSRAVDAFDSLELVVVVGEEEKSEPVEVVLLTEEELQRGASRSVAGVLKREAGVTFLSFGTGEGMPVLRGFVENGSSRALVLVDGLPVSRPDLGGVALARWSGRSVSSAAVRRGSETVRYGSGALAGVVEFGTEMELDEKEERRWHLEAAGGSFDLFSGGVWGLEKVAGGVLQVGVDWVEEDGYRRHSGRENFLSRVAWGKDFGNWKGWWKVEFGDTVLEVPDGLTEAEFRENPRQSLPDTFGLEDRYEVDLQTWRVQQNLEGENWALKVAGQRQEGQYALGVGGAQRQRWDSVVGEVVKRGESWEFGGRGRWDFLDNRFARGRAAELERWAGGAFAKGGWEVAEGVTFGIGGALDGWRLNGRALGTSGVAFDAAREGAEWSAEAEVRWQAGEVLEGWLKYARLARFPVTGEIAADPRFVLAVPFNFELKSERGHGAELGLALKGDWWEWRGAGFGTWLDNEIGFGVAENLNVNLGRTFRGGVEQRGLARWGDWEARVDWQVTWARFLDGEFAGLGVPLVPRHLFSGAVRWQPEKGARAGFGWQFVGDSVAGNDFVGQDRPLPGRTLWWLEAGWRWDSGREFFFEVENLFDRQYQATRFAGAVYPGDGRRVTAGVRYQF